MKHYTQILFKSFLLLLCSVSVSLAATVTVVPGSGSSYTVMGGDMNGVAGIELNISYDSASLASPSISQGNLVSGAMFLANANVPGNIRVAIISTTPFKGSGQIAAISFGSQTGSGGVTALTANLIDISGKPVSAQTSVAAAAGNQSTASTESAAGSTSATSTGGTSATQAATASGYSAALGTVNMPSDTQPAAGATAPAATVPAAAQPETAAPQVAEVPAAAGEPSVAAVEPAAVQAVYGAISERFRVYQGARTPAGMIGLFQKPVSSIISQDPAIAVSDGKAKVRLIADLPSGSSTAPNFALSGAKMASLKSGDVPGRWIVEAIPNKNAVKASVTILQGDSVLEYQLTVVPPAAGISGKDADFTAFLKDRDAKPPRFDLNADGKHDYLDDFIYTAHYLIVKGGGRK